MSAITDLSLRSSTTVTESLGSPESGSSPYRSFASPRRLASPLSLAEPPVLKYIRDSLNEVVRRAEILCLTADTRVACIAGRILVDTGSFPYTLMPLAGGKCLPVPLTEKGFLADMTYEQLWSAGRILGLEKTSYLAEPPSLKKIAGVDLFPEGGYAQLKDIFDRLKKSLADEGQMIYRMENPDKMWVLYALPVHIPDLLDSEGIPCLYCDRPDAYLLHTIVNPTPDRRTTIASIRTPFFEGDVRLVPGYNEYRLHYTGDAALTDIEISRSSPLGVELAKLFVPSAKS